MALDTNFPSRPSGDFVGQDGDREAEGEVAGDDFEHDHQAAFQK